MLNVGLMLTSNISYEMYLAVLFIKSNTVWLIQGTQPPVTDPVF